MNIVFTPTAWEQYTEWQREDKKLDVINRILQHNVEIWNTLPKAAISYFNAFGK